MSDGGWLLPEVIDPETVCFQISIPNEIYHITAFWGCLQQLAEWWNWQRDEDHRATLVAQVWRRTLNTAHASFVDHNCGGETMFLLRQNPDDSCQLQQSVDGGDTWTLAFDFGLCIPPQIETIGSGVQTLVDNLWGNATSPTQINVYAPITTWIYTQGESSESQEQRMQALCYAAKVMVDIAMQALIDAYQGVITLTDLAQAVLGIIGALTVLTGVSAWVGIGAAIAAAALEAFQFLTLDDLENIANDEIRQFVACKLLLNLQTRPVTEFAFKTALDAVDTSCYTEDEARAIAIMNSVLTNDAQIGDMYRGFINALGESTLAARAGLIGETCICPEETWSYCLPLDQWYVMSETQLAPYSCDYSVDPRMAAGEAVEIAGTPVWASADVTGADAQGIARKISIFVPAGTIVESVQMSYDWYVGSGNTDAWFKWLQVNGEKVCAAAFPPTIFTVDDLAISGEMMEIDMMFRLNGDIGTRLAVTAIKINGTGIPLFGGCNDCPF